MWTPKGLVQGCTQFQCLDELIQWPEMGGYRMPLFANKATLVYGQWSKMDTYVVVVGFFLNIFFLEILLVCAKVPIHI